MTTPVTQHGGAHMQHILHFTLGPVQGFVAEARRTRDLWAGSFLLSWLAGQAMRAIVEGGYGRIDFPAVDDDPLYQALSKTPAKTSDRGGAGPRIGSLPNRFRALIEKPSEFDPKAVCEDAINSKWRALADLVWDTFLKGALADDAEQARISRAIWERQINGFWDMAWVMGESFDTEEGRRADGKWLDQRKNWRTHWPAEEPGDHCMLMGDYQELSGWIRSRKEGRARQDAFWEKLRRQISLQLYRDGQDKSLLEIGKGERLCAIAVVKRLFPVLFDPRIRKEVREKAIEIIGFIPCGQELATAGALEQGEAVRIWRSTPHIAATPWLRRIAQEHPKSVVDYVAEIKKIASANKASGVLLSERKGAVPGLDGHEIEQLDGNLFFEEALLRKKPDSWGPPLDANEALRKQLAGHLLTLQEKTKANAVSRHGRAQGKANPFYALLLMDGDNMGKLIGQLGGRQMAEALGVFTKKVAAMPGDHVTIYAGGDDYFGLFPLPDVIDKALEIRGHYLDAFASLSIGTEKARACTISAAIIFAPYDLLLAHLRRESHHLLDDVAKAQNGRDSLAIRVIKGSGEMATWVSKWDGSGKFRSNAAADAMLKLARAMAGEPEQSSSFIYKLKRLYGGIYKDQAITVPEQKRLKQLMLAERLVGRDARQPKVREKAERQVETLLEACLTVSGRSNANATEKLTMRFGLEGGLIARFLADNGIADGAPAPAPAPEEGLPAQDANRNAA